MVPLWLNSLTRSVTQIYAPQNVQTYRDSHGANWLLTHLFKMALQTDLLFEATVLFIWSQLPPSRLNTTPEEHERAMASVRGSAIRKLHHRLSVPVLCSDDATIHTVLALMAGDVSLLDLRLEAPSSRKTR